jgi:hypothetical protein
MRGRDVNASAAQRRPEALPRWARATSSVKAGRSLALLLVSALATAACGSTVQTQAQSAARSGAPQSGAEGAAGDGLGGTTIAAGNGSDGTTPDGSGGSGADVTGSGARAVEGGTGAGVLPGPGASGTTPGSARGGFVSGPGVTATTIALGIPYCNDCAQASAALGFGSDDPGDTRRYFQAALDDVNARGGVLGRKLVPVFHEVSVKDNFDASMQAACETFTKDHKVAAIYSRGEIIFDCAKKAGIIAVGSGATGALFQRYPNVFSPSSIRLERLGAVTVQAMVKQGWLKPDPSWPTGKIGIVTWDTNDYHYAIDKGWLPALRTAGLKATDVRYITPPQSDSSVADASAAMSSAVLSFRQKGIDHVFLADGPAGIIASGGITTLFVAGAESQKYYPRYGFNPSNTPEDASAQLPADQMAGMLAITATDGTRANDEGMALNSQRERCFQVMRRKGLTATEGKATALYALGACETAWFSEAVLQRATSGTSVSSVIAAAESLGMAYRSPTSFGTKIGPNQHDGLYFFRNGRFDSSCSCFTYTSKAYEP